MLGRSLYRPHFYLQIFYIALFQIDSSPENPAVTKDSPKEYPNLKSALKDFSRWFQPSDYGLLSASRLFPVKLYFGKSPKLTHPHPNFLSNPAIQNIA